MANEVLQGKLIGVTIGEDFIQCQTDATLSISVATSVTDPCKPTPDDTGGGVNWDRLTIDSKSWNITFNAKAFAMSTKFTQAEIIDLMVNKDPKVTVTFATTKTTDYAHTETQVFNGDGIITEFNWEAPATGESTYSATVAGNGKPTFVRTPVVGG